VRSPNFATVPYANISRVLKGKHAPVLTLVLGSGCNPMEVSRPDEKTLVIRPEGGFFAVPGAWRTDPEIERLLFHQGSAMESLDRLYRDRTPMIEGQRIKDIAERAEKRSAEAEDRADRRIREAQERAERDVRPVKEDGDKRVADAERIWKDRLEDERRNHERELRSLNTNFDTRLSTEKSVADNARIMLQSEVERERAEKMRFQQEATEKGDIVAQVQKVTAVAESLGMKPAGESETAGDWKSQLLQVGVNLAQNLPEIVQNAGDAVAKAKNPHVQVIQQPGMYAPPALPPARRSIVRFLLR